MRHTIDTDQITISETTHARIIQAISAVPTTDTITISETVHAVTASTTLISPARLVFVFSGGPNNTEPALSLGGEKSLSTAGSTLGDFGPTANMEADYTPLTDFHRIGDQIAQSGVILSTLFNDVTKTEAQTPAPGSFTYRCIYAQNNDPVKSMDDLRVWIYQNTPAGDHIKIGVGVSGINDIEPAIGDQTEKPAGVQFVDVNPTTGQPIKVGLGDLDPNGGHRAIWLERHVPPNTTAMTGNKYMLMASFYSDHD
jgi:hypothetical protein